MSAGFGSLWPWFRRLGSKIVVRLADVTFTAPERTLSFTALDRGRTITAPTRSRTFTAGRDHI